MVRYILRTQEPDNLLTTRGAFCSVEQREDLVGIMTRILIKLTFCHQHWILGFFGKALHIGKLEGGLSSFSLKDQNIELVIERKELRTYLLPNYLHTSKYFPTFPHCLVIRKYLLPLSFSSHAYHAQNQESTIFSSIQMVWLLIRDG